MYGHYKSECRINLSKTHGEKSHFAENEEEEVSLLIVCYDKEEMSKNMWDLDTGCSNHMCGDKSFFSSLDESLRDNVKFGNNSKVSIMGKGEVIIQTNNWGTQTISNILFVLDLKTNLLSISQLQEKDYEVSIKNDVCQIQDTKLGLIAQVTMIVNWIFPLYLNNVKQTCFYAKLKDMA